MTTALTRIIVPCYNEEQRLDAAGFAAFLDEPGVGLLFVDDGSTDGTARTLADLASRLGGRAEVMILPRNGGKAEAVRLGLLRALERGADVVGYADADLATPPEELLRMRRTLLEGGHDAVLGARVRILGCRIERNSLRHYLGRVFATGASLTLGLPVYDTQCGAKLFRRTPALEAALGRPFASRWAFDVELIGRLLLGNASAPGLPVEAFVEIPLRRWRDVPGSKVRPWDLPRALGQLWTIRKALRRYPQS